ncbi:hypothetical protein LEP1GSC038_2931 [Leptospira weilii str. 2006001855]|uniref:Uncharacterized protein n=1 Tax=Leptospira weilii str. 2006001855 TaxID=996804 RepID=M6G398_9LEPT|nr:hypothetical protein LEP1GSC038_2931 [Leptospira weilii str. 2006001855]
MRYSSLIDFLCKLSYLRLLTQGESKKKNVKSRYLTLKNAIPLGMRKSEQYKGV